jgi:hypothetical protein
MMWLEKIPQSSIERTGLILICLDKHCAKFRTVCVISLSFEAHFERYNQPTITLAITVHRSCQEAMPLSKPIQTGGIGKCFS